jgi:hypothetical protein
VCICLCVCVCVCVCECASFYFQFCFLFRLLLPLIIPFFVCRLHIAYFAMPVVVLPLLKAYFSTELFSLCSQIGKIGCAPPSWFTPLFLSFFFFFFSLFSRSSPISSALRGEGGGHWARMNAWFCNLVVYIHLIFVFLGFLEIRPQLCLFRRKAYFDGVVVSPHLLLLSFLPSSIAAHPPKAGSDGLPQWDQLPWVPSGASVRLVCVR